MQVEVTSQRPNGASIKLIGRITADIGDWSDMHWLDGVLQQSGQRPCVIANLAEARYVDSSGVSWLLKLHQRLREANGRLVLHSIPATVKNVFAVLKMDKVFEIAANEHQALESIADDGSAGEQKDA